MLKLWSDINRKAAKLSPLSSSKIDKYEYLTGEEVLPSDQRRIVVSEKQIKTIGNEGVK